MSTTEPFRALDLFAGAGGLSTGLALAMEDLETSVDHVAINHWDRAIETHERNHPEATQYHAKVEEIPPSQVFPEADSIDLLTAGPECTHFSSARGGKPVSEQARTSPWHVLDWVEKVRPKQLLMENVPEIQSWGPIEEDGTPSRNGKLWEAWVDSLHALGYSVDWKVLNAADFGDPTSRRRLFIVGRRDHQPVFPEPTHSKNGEAPGTEKWRPAAEIIDWSDIGKSVWSRDLERKRVHSPPKDTTMQRIAEGLRRYGDERIAGFADVIDEIGRDEIRSMRDDPVSLDELPTAAQERDGPFLVEQPAPVSDIFAGSNGTEDTDTPSYLLPQHSGGQPQNVEVDPVPTVASRGAISIVSPQSIVLPRNGRARGLHSNQAYDPNERPLHTVTASNHDGHLVSPYLVPFYGERAGQSPRTHDIDEPLPTVTATGSPPAVTEPYLVQYYGNSDVASLEKPLPTVTTKDRFALVVPDLYPWGLDIRFRMLKPRELARAMGFPEDYEFAGNKSEVTRQIGNAVPVQLAKSLIKTLIVDETPSLFSHSPEAKPVATDGGRNA